MNIINATVDAVFTSTDSDVSLSFRLRGSESESRQFTVYFVVIASEVLASFDAHFAHPVTLARFVLDHMHGPTADFVCNRLRLKQAQDNTSQLELDNLDDLEVLSSASCSARWEGSVDVHVGGFAQRSWTVVWAPAPPAKTSATRTRQQLYGERPRSGRLRPDVGRKMPLPVFRIALATPARVSPKSAVSEVLPCSFPDRLLSKHSCLLSQQQVTELANHFYRFLMGCSDSKTCCRRFCPLYATRLSVPIELPAGIKSANFDAFVTFLSDGCAIAELHRHLTAAHSATKKSHRAKLHAVEASQRLHISRTGAFEHAPRACQPNAKATSRQAPFNSLDPATLLEAIKELCFVSQPSTRSIYAPMEIGWLDVVLLCCVESKVWKTFLLPLLLRLNESKEDDELLRIAAAIGLGSGPGQICDLLLDTDRSGYVPIRRIVGGRRLRPAEVVTALMPVRFWRLAIEPYHCWNNGRDSCHLLPVTTAKQVAVRQLKALQSCALLGDEAGFSLAHDSFRRWYHHLQAQQDERRRNQLIRSALDRKFSTGSLQHRYFRKWAHWLRGKRKQQRRAVFLAAV